MMAVGLSARIAVRNWCVLVRISKLVIGEGGAVLHDQAAQDPDQLRRRASASGQPWATMAETTRSAMPVGLSGAKEEELLVDELASGHTQCREDARESHGRRTLNVVIKGAGAIAICAQRRGGVVGEVFELDHHARKDIT